MPSERKTRSDNSANSWALRKGELPRELLIRREAKLREMEENAVFRAIAYVEHVFSRRSGLRSNEYLAISLASTSGIIPLLLGFWPATPVAVLIVIAIFLQARARERSEALGRFLQAEQGVLKDLMLAGLPIRDWSIALWARHVAIQRPYWILGFNVLLYMSLLGIMVWTTPFWINDRIVPILLCVVTFSYMSFIAWYHARLRYLPWTDLTSVVFQPKAYRLGRKFLRRIPLQIDQARVALLTQLWVFGVMAGSFGVGLLLLRAEAAGRVPDWRESASFALIAFPPIWAVPGMLLGSVTGMFWGIHCKHRVEPLLAKVDVEVERLLELIRQRSESD